MEVTPFFSIIIPTYNVEPFIRQTLESVFSQSFKDWELIIVDDCSSDKTPILLKEYENSPYIKIIYLSSNLGNPFLVRKEAISHAAGKYIVAIDADDYVDKDYLKSIYNEILGFNADMVLTEMWRYDGLNSYKILPKTHILSNKKYIGKELVKYTLLEWELPTSGAVRTSIYKKGIDLTLNSNINSIHSDELLTRYLLYLSDNVVLTKTRYFYRDNPSSITHNKLRQAIGSFITNKALSDFCRKYFGEGSYEFNKIQKQIFFYYIYLLQLYTYLSSESEKKTIKEIALNVKALIKKETLPKDIHLQYVCIYRSPFHLGCSLIRYYIKIRKLLK